mgnify:CR=1 FL=1
MQIEVPAVPQLELMKQQTAGEKSSVIRQRVEKAHQLQLDRKGKTNNRLSVKEIDQHCALDNARESAETSDQSVDRTNSKIYMVTKRFAGTTM